MNALRYGSPSAVVTISNEPNRFVRSAYVSHFRPRNSLLLLTDSSLGQQPVLSIYPWSVQHVSDSDQDQNVLADGDSRRRSNREEEPCLVSGSGEEEEWGVYYRQRACELWSSNEQQNQPGKWKQQSDRDEEPCEGRSPQLVHTSLDSQRSQQEAEHKAQPKQGCQYSLCSAERRYCLGQWGHFFSLFHLVATTADFMAAGDAYSASRVEMITSGRRQLWLNSWLTLPGSSSVSAKSAW